MQGIFIGRECHKWFPRTGNLCQYGIENMTKLQILYCSSSTPKKLNKDQNCCHFRALSFWLAEKFTLRKQIRKVRSNAHLIPGLICFILTARIFSRNWRIEWKKMWSSSKSSLFHLFSNSDGKKYARWIIMVQGENKCRKGVNCFEKKNECYKNYRSFCIF